MYRAISVNYIACTCMHCNNRVVVLTHIGLPLLQPWQQRMYSLHRETQLDHVSSVGLVTGGERYALLFGISIPLKLEKYLFKVIHLFTHYFVARQQLQ